MLSSYKQLGKKLAGYKSTRSDLRNKLIDVQLLEIKKRAQDKLIQGMTNFTTELGDVLIARETDKQAKIERAKRLPVPEAEIPELETLEDTKLEQDILKQKDSDIVSRTVEQMKVAKPKFSLYKFFELNQPIVGPLKKPMEGELSLVLKDDGSLDMLDSSTNYEPSLLDNLGKLIDTDKPYTLEIMK